MLYRYSPIRNEKGLLDAVKYTVTESSKLCKKTIKTILPITSITIFSHYPKEYEQLTRLINKLGIYYNENNGLRVKLAMPITIFGHKIQYIRVRKPDPYRMQVGCVDYNIRGYDSFKKKYLNNTGLREIKRPDYAMIEFYNPDYDVLGYVVSEKIH